MSRMALFLNCLLCLLYSTAASAWGYQGHRVVGSIADRMLKDNAKQQVSQILGFELRIAGPWADCVKSVVKNADGTFTYKEDPSHPEYEIPCTSFRTPIEQKRMEDYVARNWSQCQYPPKGGKGDVTIPTISMTSPSNVTVSTEAIGERMITTS